jgi:hypothetical protein
VFILLWLPFFKNMKKYFPVHNHVVAQLVEELRYKTEGRGFDSRQGDWDA